MEFPFGWTGMLITAVIAYFIFSSIIERTLEKKGIKPSTQYKDLQESQINPTSATAVITMIIIVTLYATMEYTKIGWLQIGIITITIAAITYAYTFSIGGGKTYKLGRA